MSQIYLIRHAQSANNAQEEHLRVPDPGLTELGHCQAERTAEWLARHSITHIHTSPFLRALQTTEPIARQTGVNVSIRADIFEQGGCYRGYLPGEKIGQPGLSQCELALRHPDWRIDEDINELGWWRSRQYESLEEATVRARKVTSWINAELSKNGGWHAIVTHGDFKRLLVSELLGLPLDSLRLGPIVNAAISSFSNASGHWEMDWYNSVGHLPIDWITT